MSRGATIQARRRLHRMLGGWFTASRTILRPHNTGYEPLRDIRSIDCEAAWRVPKFSQDLLDGSQGRLPTFLILRQDRDPAELRATANALVVVVPDDCKVVKNPCGRQPCLDLGAETTAGRPDAEISRQMFRLSLPTAQATNLRCLHLHFTELPVRSYLEASGEQLMNEFNKEPVLEVPGAALQGWKLISPTGKNQPTSSQDTVKVWLKPRSPVHVSCTPSFFRPPNDRGSLAAAARRSFELPDPTAAAVKCSRLFGGLLQLRVIAPTGMPQCNDLNGTRRGFDEPIVEVIVDATQ